MSETAQTLDRGLRLLHLVADAPAGLTVTEAAASLGVGRAVVYRLAGALAAHGMIRRDAAGRLKLGPGVLHLARRAQPLLADAAVPVLRRLAEQVGATAHLTVADGTEGVAIAVVEPSWTAYHVAYRAGSRHPLTVGAAGRAILAGRALLGNGPAAHDRRAALTTHDPRAAPTTDNHGDAPAHTGRAAVAQGPVGRGALVVSSGELQPGAHGVAAPVLGVPGLEASVGVVALEPLDLDTVGPRVTAAATSLTTALS